MSINPLTPLPASIVEEGKKAGENLAEAQSKPINTPEEAQLKQEKVASALRDSFYWFLTVLFMIIPQLVGLKLQVGAILSIAFGLFWILYSGWVKKMAELRIKDSITKYEVEKFEKDETKAKNVQLTEENKRLIFDNEKINLQNKDLAIIQSKLVENVKQLSDTITSKLSKM